MIFKLAISIILFILTIIPSSARQIWVSLFHTPPQVISVRSCAIKTSEGAHFTVSAKSLDITNSSGMLMAGTHKVRSYIKIYPINSSSPVAILGDHSSQYSRYQGWIEIRPQSGRLLAINHIDIEDYLCSVLPGEMPQRWPFQAYASQAIVARSYACSSIGRHASEGYDLCSLTHCQIYHGVSYERSETTNAVHATSGLILTYQGKPVPAPYHSTCGGITTDGLYDGHGKELFLLPVSDVKNGKAYCAVSPHFRWRSTVSPESVASALRADGEKAPLHASGIRVLQTDSSGRAVLIRMIGAPSADVSGCDVMMSAGRHMGWQTIKSTLFTTMKSDAKIVFEGKGLGHGMGMCQWGARGMAGKGCSLTEILEHYFPKCRIAQFKVN